MGDINCVISLLSDDEEEQQHQSPTQQQQPTRRHSVVALDDSDNEDDLLTHNIYGYQTTSKSYSQDGALTAAISAQSSITHVTPSTISAANRLNNNKRRRNDDDDSFNSTEFNQGTQSRQLSQPNKVPKTSHSNRDHPRSHVRNREAVRPSHHSTRSTRASTSCNLTKKELEAIQKEFHKRVKGKYSHLEICIKVEQSLLSSVGGKDIRDTFIEEFSSNQLLSERMKITNQIIWCRSVPSNFCEYLMYCANCEDNHVDVDMAEFYVNHYKECRTEDREEELVVVPIPYLMLVRIPGDNIVELIQAGTLNGYIAQVCAEFKRQYDRDIQKDYVSMFEDSTARPTVILLIEGLQSFLKSKQQARYRQIMSGKKSKNKKASNNNNNSNSNDNGSQNLAAPPSMASDPFSEQLIERSLIQLQLEFNCNIYQTKNAQESADFIVGISKNLAEAPYKRQTSVIDFRAGAASGAMRYIYDKSNEDDENEDDSQTGKKKMSNEEIWCRQLMEVPSVSEKLAQTIVQIYPTVGSLLAAYERIDRTVADKRERIEKKQNMLRDIRCEWKVGEGSRMDQRSVRKLGPAVSAKIYMAFNATDGE